MIIHRQAAVRSTIKQVNLIRGQQGQDGVQTHRGGSTSLLSAVACFSYVITFSNKADRLPKLTAVQGCSLENLLKRRWHMTTRDIGNKC